MLAIPSGHAAEVLAHLRACRACRAFHERNERLERTIAEALAVPVPWTLVPAILERGPARAREQRRRFLAWAASVGALALGLGAGAGLLAHDDPEALAGIEFVMHEEANAILTAAPPDPSALRRAVDTLGIRLPPQLGHIRYIGTCPYEGTIAHHVIVTTPYGKVTLLLAPDRGIGSRKSASARGLRALVAPAGRGCVTVIAGSARSVRRIEEMVLRA